MAITGKFLADFSDFSRAVDQSVSKLTTFETGAARVGTALNRMATAFSGKRVIQDATLMAKAVEDIGGTAKLTSTELQRLGTQANEAIAKMRAMGMQVPAGLQKIATAANAANKSVGFLGSTFAQAFAGFTAAGIAQRVIGSFTSIASEAFTTAGAMVDLSSKTGLSLTTLQQMDHVAKQSGSNMEAFADAAFKMGVNVAEGTRKAREGAEAMGLSWKALRDARPDEQFNMVVEALEKMEAGQARNEAAVAVFGKSAGPILQAIADGYIRVAREATIAGEAQVKAVANAGDAYERGLSKAKTAATTFIGNIVMALENAKRRGGNLGLLGAVLNPFGAMANLAESPAPPPEAPPPAGSQATPIPPDFVRQLQEATEATARLTQAQKDQIVAAVQLGISHDDIINTLDVTEGMIKQVVEAWKADEAAAKKAAEESKKTAAEWKKILDERKKDDDDWNRKKQANAERDRQFTIELGRAQQEADIAKIEAEARFRREVEATNKKLREQRLEAEAIARSLGSVVEYDLSTKEGMAEFKRQNPGAEVNAPTEYFQTHTLADAMRQGLVKFNSVGQSGGYAASGLGAPRSQFAPMAWGGEPGRGKYGQEPTVVINVNGVIDQSSKDAIAQASADGIVRRVSNGAALGGW